MKKIVFLFCVLISTVCFAQQREKNFFPVETNVISLNEEDEKEIQRRDVLLEKESLTKKETFELDILLEKYSETTESIWDIIGGGCSWYCGGGNYKILTSSSLKSQSGNTYDAESANDLSYKTAWVEGQENEGRGEYIEYHFEHESPRITAIIIANGYVKSDIAWRNNNRVKSLKLYVNEEYFGVLNLTDTRSDQRFELGTFGRNEDGSDLRIRFEINEVYRGKKYNDTAISEIYFDGIDVH